MQIISLLLYNISIKLYGLGIFIASFFNAKARLWTAGRNSQRYITLTDKKPGAKRIWVHCASLGEFEQARPVIEKIKQSDPTSFIVLTFFSPSGYEIRKNYKYANTVLYLPVDTAANAARFIDRVQPDLALFVKYEFWYHYLTELKKRKVPVALFSAIFRKEQIFFKWYGGLFRNMLYCFDKIFVQNKESQQLLNAISVQSEISFDTRFDRVHQIAESARPFATIERFKDGNRILIAGSTWQKDEQLIIPLINNQALQGYKYIIAPHNLNGYEISKLQKELQAKTVLFSQLTLTNATEATVVILDTMGDLSSLYQYADIAYVGGGFNASVHNVLEPAIYGLPVIFGPNYLKSAEAKELRQLSAAFPVSDTKQLQTIVTGLATKTETMKKSSASAKQYMQQHLGGVNDIYKYISRYL